MCLNLGIDAKHYHYVSSSIILYIFLKQVFPMKLELAYLTRNNLPVNFKNLLFLPS